MGLKRADTSRSLVLPCVNGNCCPTGLSVVLEVHSVLSSLLATSHWPQLVLVTWVLAQGTSWFIENKAIWF